MTMNYVEEAIDIVRAARNHNLPVVISFTVETDGCLPNGQSWKAAIVPQQNLSKADDGVEKGA